MKQCTYSHTDYHGNLILRNGKPQMYRFAGGYASFDADTIDGYAFDLRPIPLDRFYAIDPLAEKYYSISPYAYCAGDPVNCVDPDGKRTIYINGFTMSSSKLGDISYWNEPGNNMLSTFSQIDNSREDPIFLDGSVGSHYRKDGSYSLNPNLRKHNGLLDGDVMAADIAASLQKNENGDYIEPVYIVTHSMGAAYAKGFVEALINYFEENGGGMPIITEFDFQPHQPEFQKAHPKVETYQISHDNDPVVGNTHWSGLNFHSSQGEIEGAIQIPQHPQDRRNHDLEGNNNILDWIRTIFQ